MGHRQDADGPPGRAPPAGFGPPSGRLLPSELSGSCHTHQSESRAVAPAPAVALKQLGIFFFLAEMNYPAARLRPEMLSGHYAAEIFIRSNLENEFFDTLCKQTAVFPSRLDGTGGAN